MCSHDQKTNEAPSLTACKWTFGCHFPFWFQIRNAWLSRHKPAITLSGHFPKISLGPSQRLCHGSPHVPLEHQTAVSTPSACSFVGCTCPLSKAQLRSADLSFCIAWQAGSQSMGHKQLGEDPPGEGRRARPRGNLGSAVPQKGGLEQARGRYYI